MAFQRSHERHTRAAKAATSTGFIALLAVAGSIADRFYRGASDGDGAGLGLALVKRVADMHGGTVRFVPGLDGRGLGVELALPLAVAGQG